MRKSVIAMSVATLLASIAAASAGEVTGTISAIDDANKTITLDGGKTFMLANEGSAMDKSKSSAVASSFKMGDKVKIVYDEKDGKMMATQVSPAM